MKSEIIKTDTSKEPYRFIMGCMYTTMDSPLNTIVLCSENSNTELLGVVIYNRDLGFDNDGDSWNTNHFTRFHGTIQLTD